MSEAGRNCRLCGEAVYVISDMRYYCQNKKCRLDHHIKLTSKAFELSKRVGDMMEETFNITVNDNDWTFIEGSTVAIMLRVVGSDPQSVIVQVNQEIIKRSEYGSRLLKEGDVVEYLYAMSGGSGTETKKALASQRIKEALPCPFCGASQWRERSHIGRVSGLLIELFHVKGCAMASPTLIRVMSSEVRSWNTREGVPPS